ncbi:MAG TPA: Hsp20/alpha crystallin family protein [Candidatus Polarisedimenticolia bacterium]|jgi:HSP20 family protein|nr:Hsp20/alpha crystallin family protein [Candidatus Polarisedimenticolia bacterium]
MLTVSRWEPYRDMLTFQNRLNRLLGDSVQAWNSPEGVGSWVPPVDVVEEPERLVFRAEIPGVSKEDIDIKLENGTLTLRGEKKMEQEVQGETTHRVERFYGSFTRSFALPATIDAGRIQARYKDGVLELVLPKAEVAKPRKIEIVAS